MPYVSYDSLSGMQHDTYGTSADGGHAAPDVSTSGPWPKLMKALGVTTKQAVAARAGVELRTIQRLFDNPGPREMRHALRLRAVTGVGIDEMFPHNPRELSEAA